MHTYMLCIIHICYVYLSRHFAVVLFLQRNCEGLGEKPGHRLDGVGYIRQKCQTGCSKRIQLAYDILHGAQKGFIRLIIS